MEATALFLLLLLPPADTAGETAAGIQASLHHELGEASMVIAPETLVTPSMWQGERAPMRARFVVRVSRKNADSVRIDLLADSGSETYHGGRDLAFAPEDGKADRGRAIGLVIAELLRSSPTAAWADGKAGGAPSVAPSRLQLGGAFAAEQPAAGSWAYGPALTYGFGLSEAFQLRASAMALFGSRDQYKDMGLTVGANWDFLRWGQNRHALGVGLFAGYLYESATFTVGTGEHSSTSTPAQSNLEVGLNLRGRLGLWRSLRLVAEGGVRLVSNRIAGPTTIPGDDEVTLPVKSPVVYQRWRPMFSVGLELPM
jgi:hypothetical protein